MKFIGRENEKQMIKGLFASEDFESLLVYGRRRIGNNVKLKIM